MTTNAEIVRWQILATAAIAVLAAVGTLLGLLQPGFYRDPSALVYQAYGQDIVTLVVGVPLLLYGLISGMRGSLRGYVIWLGALAYMLYTYAVYAVITEFNPFFLGYVALFGLSLFALVGGILRLDPEAVKARLEPDLPTRLLVWFFLGMGVLVALLWLSEVIPATLAGTKPESVAEIGLPANVVHVLDLGVLVPAIFVTAKWLREGRPWGYVLPGVLFVKLTTIGLAVLAMIVWMSQTGTQVALPEVVVFVVLTLGNVLFAVLYLRSIREPEAGGGVVER